jgi:Polysaccharide biosynthesis enzyme WcbI
MLLSNLDRRVLTALKDRAFGRLKPGPRIAVLGNCQSFDLAYAMKLLTPGATVHQYPIQSKAKITRKMLVRALRGYDHVFLQDFGPGLVRGATSEFLCNELAHTTRYPSLLFGAYHPDSIFIHRGAADAFISGPIGQHHSALALFAYRAGLPVEAALRLYTREVFETLGYFDLWRPASTQFLEHARSYGLQLEADFMRWTRRGCFMYSVNHPKSFVFFDLAHHLLDTAGISSQPIDFQHYALNDLARDTVFPVYPEVAEHFGLPGSYIFKAPKHSPGGLSLGNFFDLHGFISGSHRVYARHAPGALANERVQGWLDSSEISRLLMEFCSAPIGRGRRSKLPQAPGLTPVVA